MYQRRRTAWGQAFCAIATSVMALCAPSAALSQASDGRLYAQTSDARRAQIATEAGQAAARKAGPKAKWPSKKKVGVLILYKSNETAMSMADAVKDAANLLGWEYIDCDGFGNPARIASCADALLNQQIDVLLTTSIEPGIIRKQLDDARRQGILSVVVGSAVSDPAAYDGYFSLDETPVAKMQADRLATQLDLTPGKKKIALQTFSQLIVGRQREQELKAMLARRSDVVIVQEHRIDNTKVAEDTRRAAEAMVAANPDLFAIWVGINSGFPYVGQVVANRYAGKKSPERPLVLGFYDEPINLDALRKGWGDVIASHHYWPVSWIAMDQVAEYFARKRPLEKDAANKAVDIYGVPLFEPLIITADNVRPPPGRYPAPTDIPAFFKAKWQAEYVR
jgi:ABC-type sugar transport system substrate-binding protein